jgi:hypothetical protein
MTAAQTFMGLFAAESHSEHVHCALGAGGSAWEFGNAAQYGSPTGCDIRSHTVGPAAMHYDSSDGLIKLRL